MTEQPSAEAQAAARTFIERKEMSYGERVVIYKIAMLLDAFAARSRREAIKECADVCRSLGQYSGRNVQPAIEQIADQIEGLK